VNIRESDRYKKTSEMIRVLFGLILRYMEMIVFYSQLVPHAAQGAVSGLAVFKPDLP